MGEVRVPAEHYWGAQTQRSLEHFPIGTENFRWGRRVIWALGVLKLAAARANEELGRLPQDKAELIERAAAEVMDGALDAEFPLVVFQTGSGTQSNMNANEVIANRADELAGTGRGRRHAGPPQRRRQPGAVEQRHLPGGDAHRRRRGARGRPGPGDRGAARHPRRQAGEFDDVVMVGRTHLQDATPVTLGQVISGWVAQLDQALATVRGSLPGLHELALGGTAVGTGLNTDPRFAETAAAHISELTGKPFHPAAQLLRRALRARRRRQRERGAAHAGRRAHEARQRRALVRLRPARRHRRAAHPRERAGVEHHARQGEPHPGRGAHPGRRARVRQRRDRGVRRLAGQLPAQRLQAGDAARAARVGAAAGARPRARSTRSARAASSPTAR